MAASLGISESTVSQHLTVLSASGLVRKQRARCAGLLPTQPGRRGPTRTTGVVTWACAVRTRSIPS
uniref:ArsR family transcriptional regulator n=1 Tax=Salinispora vitiensis TaxID=999544 RepID=UPI0037CA05F2